MVIDLEREWDVLAELLPEDWQGLARQTGAIRRARGIDDAESLLRLLLMHVATGLSLRSTVARAAEVGGPAISAVGLMKRLQNAEGWLGSLTERLFASSRFSRGTAGAVLAGRRVRVVDATSIEEPGATGTDWRVHYSVGLNDLRCDYFRLTSPKTGESFKRFPLRPGDILMGDRGYCHRDAVGQVKQRGADVIVRLNLNNFPLLTRDGQPFDILPHLRSLTGHQPGRWLVQFETKKGARYEAQLCAVRKTQIAAERAKRGLRKREKRKNGKKQRLLPETLESAEYLYVLTTLAEDELTPTEVLELYRLRWQVELVFKRLKTLLRLGHLPKRTDSSARAWLQAKLLVALLIERLAEKASFFSPWGHDLAAPQPLA